MLKDESLFVNKKTDPTELNLRGGLFSSTFCSDTQFGHNSKNFSIEKNWNNLCQIGDIKVSTESWENF